MSEFTIVLLALALIGTTLFLYVLFDTKHLKPKHLTNHST